MNTINISYSSRSSDPVLGHEDWSFSASQLLKIFFSMLFIRRFEERCADFYAQGRIRGFCHLCIGQEAIPVALQWARNVDVDSIITAYRCHGYMLACGADAKAVMLELLGMDGGSSKGKGGSMHLFSTQNKFYGGHGIVGASSALGTGLAFAHKYRQDGGVCIACFGDGAANQGQFFESMNMAALWHLPVLYVIENNGYSMGTSVERGCANSNALYSRGNPFGIPGYCCQGDDFFEVFTHVKKRISEVRERKGPVVLEIQTHRFKGHSMSDPGTYRSKETLEHVKKNKDPIKNLKLALQQVHGVTLEEIALQETQVKHLLQDILQWVETAQYPLVSALDDHVYTSHG
ncbi:pyruvate dehydrogenase (acetyl-transferring) E1 component subunit alpha [Holospora curviuscula]|uniref:Pyruvate dehydrogenase E1 component subunit alpha n=1 Tax=Holospora curviuscula TaxID=1082868 RepID=A0A2S5R941_9PROT|nr:pyruvate dehydrogenase (acetyl-transferring) E1 component subunit alpha [Holospora curviuscula]PPE03838.1 Acetoin:2,6-dichlorophenolindophenol oxidoreductase subunit alpha [Holospora curviuscula]